MNANTVTGAIILALGVVVSAALVWLTRRERGPF